MGEGGDAVPRPGRVLGVKQAGCERGSQAYHGVGHRGVGFIGTAEGGIVHVGLQVAGCGLSCTQA